MLLKTGSIVLRQQSRYVVRYYAAASQNLLAMKAGTTIPGLGFLKDKDAPASMERSEYPEWVNRLDKSLPSLARLRLMPEEEASDKEMLRYLKLTRRNKIKSNNGTASL
mmetsp:Transcript_6001/g.8659  ORF Transcript_6001/g.8659 Transcript_6001/m.8659 type:complete len:109 (+) Transcript_6001:108-434(+)